MPEEFKIFKQVEFIVLGFRPKVHYTRVLNFTLVNTK